MSQLRKGYRNTKTMQKSNHKKTVLFLGNNIPSYSLGVRLPLDRNVRPDNPIDPIFFDKAVYHFSLNKDLRVNLLWVVRRCDRQTIFLVNLAMKQGLPLVYEFDDRFDLLPTTDMFHTSVGVVAGFFWMISKSNRTKSYTNDAGDLFPISWQEKITIGSQYSPKFVEKSSISRRWQSRVVKVAILSNTSNPKLIESYNKVTSSLKRRYGSSVQIYSFSKAVFADHYMKPERELLKYYKKIERKNFHFSLNFSANFASSHGKTPNKFREAAGFGYLCATNDAPEFDEIPEELLLKAETPQKLMEKIFHLIENRDQAIAIAEKAYAYASENFNINRVSEEIASLALENSSEYDLPLSLEPIYFGMDAFRVMLSKEHGQILFDVAEVLKYLGLAEDSDCHCPGLIIGPPTDLSVIRSNLYIEVSFNDGVFRLNLLRRLNHLGKDWELQKQISANNRFEFLVGAIEIALALPQRHQKVVEWMFPSLFNRLRRIVR